MTEKRIAQPPEKEARFQPTDTTIRQAVDWIVQEVHPLQILLFGSAARRQLDSHSDLDFLVVMPEGTHKRQTAHKLYRKLRGLAVPVDVLVTTATDLDRHQNNPGLIYQTILREGQRLYVA